MSIQNPFIPGTLSYLLFAKVKSYGNGKPPPVKIIFNQIGQSVGGAELANHVLERDGAWLYEEFDKPERPRKLKLNHRIRFRRRVNKEKYEGQLANTHRHVESRKLREENYGNSG